MEQKYKGETMNKFVKFMKKNGYYIALVVCALLIAAVITLSVIVTQKNSLDDPAGALPTDPGGDIPSGGDDVDPDPMKFLFPVSGECVVNYKTWVNDNGWKMHCGVDFLSEAGTKVQASYTGKVVSVEEKAGVGQTLVIRYDNGTLATYKGLANGAKLDGGVVLKTDSPIAQGQHIGTVAEGRVLCNSDIKETHLHVELKDANVTDVNAYLDPSKLFEADNK